MIKLLIISLPLDNYFWGSENPNYQTIIPIENYDYNNDDVDEIKIQHHNNNSNNNWLYIIGYFALAILVLIVGCIGIWYWNKNKEEKTNTNSQVIIDTTKHNIQQAIINNSIEEEVTPNTRKNAIITELNNNFNKFQRELDEFYYQEKNKLNCSTNGENFIKMRKKMETFLNTITPENIKFIKKDYTLWETKIENEQEFFMKYSYYTLWETTRNKEQKSFIKLIIDESKYTYHNRPKEIQKFTFILTDNVSYENFANQKSELLNFIDKFIAFEQEKAPIIELLNDNINKLDESIKKIMQPLSSEKYHKGFTIENNKDNLLKIYHIINDFFYKMNSINKDNIYITDRINKSFNISINKDKIIYYKNCYTRFVIIIERYIKNDYDEYRLMFIFGAIKTVDTPEKAMRKFNTDLLKIKEIFNEIN